MDQEANDRLLKAPWYPIMIKNLPNDNHENECIYYVKYHISKSDYRLLVTDLRHVWYNTVDEEDLYKQARQQRLLIETKPQFQQLLRQLEAFLRDLGKNCKIRKEEDKLKIICGLQQKVGTLSWIFLCELLPGSSSSDLYVDAPTVLYNHFILPMLMLVQNQPDIQQDEHLFEKPTQIYPVKQSWLKGIQQASTNILQSNLDNEKDSPQPQSETTPDYIEPSSEIDVVQGSQQLPSPSVMDQQANSGEEEELIVRIRPPPKKRRMFG